MPGLVHALTGGIAFGYRRWMKSIPKDIEDQARDIVRRATDERVRILKSEFESERHRLARRMPVSPEHGAFVSEIAKFTGNWLEESVVATWESLSELLANLDSPIGLANDAFNLLSGPLDQLERVAYGIIFLNASDDNKGRYGPHVQIALARAKDAAMSGVRTKAEILEAKLTREYTFEAQRRRWQLKLAIIGGSSLFRVGERNAKLRHLEVELAQQQVDHRDQIPA